MTRHESYLKFVTGTALRIFCCSDKVESWRLPYFARTNVKSPVPLPILISFTKEDQQRFKVVNKQKIASSN